MTWIEHARHGSSASDVSKLVMEKFAAITTDHETDNAKTKRELANVKSVNVTVPLQQLLKQLNMIETWPTLNLMVFVDLLQTNHLVAVLVNVVKTEMTISHGLTAIPIHAAPVTSHKSARANFFKIILLISQLLNLLFK